MDLIDNKTDAELLATMLQEVAKAQSETRCASKDLEKAQKRLSFALLLVNRLKDRQDEIERPGQRTHFSKSGTR